MSAAQRMPIVGGTLAIGVSGAAMALIPSLRETITRYLGISAPGGIWRILAIFFALLSLKSLPFVWHVSDSLPLSPPSSKPSHFADFQPLVPRLQKPHLAPLPATPPSQTLPPLRTHHHNITQLPHRMRLQLSQVKLNLLLRFRRQSRSLCRCSAQEIARSLEWR